MSGFGGAVKLSGESEYRKALQLITQNLKEVSSEMKAVSSSFDSNDKSVKSVKAQTEALNKVLAEQNKKLDTLKAQYSTMQGKYNEQSKAHAELVKAYDKEKNELDRIGKSLGTTSKEYQDQKTKVSNLSKEVERSSNAQIENEKTMSKMRTSINQAQTEVNKTTHALKDLAESEKDAGDEAQKSSDGGFTVMKGVLSNLASTVITSAVNGMKQLGATIIDVGKQSLEAYGDYEQLVGGVETLFGTGGKNIREYADSVGKSVEEVSEEYNNLLKAQDRVLADSRNAYKEAGLSQNEYMETVTSFSASLIQSLEGDTLKASEYSKRAIIDMSDNANKMGTDISSLQNAYQGFAKQNYTMLDNLKLGYGGTKTEMERLIADASELTDIQEKLGVTIDKDSMSFGNIVNAISVMQEKMGIAGTTSKEASETIQGSTQAMKSAWQNLLIGMADDNANFDEIVSNFSNSLTAMLDNVLPRIQTIITGMGNTVGKLLETVVPEVIKTIPPLLTETAPILLDAVENALTSLLGILPDLNNLITQNIIPEAVNMIISSIPLFIDSGIQILMGLIQGIKQTIPVLTDTIPSVIESAVNIITSNLPLLVDAGIELIDSFASGILSAIPLLLDEAPMIISSVLGVLNSELPKILSFGVELLDSLIQGILSAMPQLNAMLPSIIEETANTLTSQLQLIVSTGISILQSIINGILSAMPLLIDMLPSIINTTVSVLLSNSGLIIQCGFDILVAVIDGLNLAMPELIKMLPSIIKTIVSVIGKNLPKIVAIGSDITIELTAGIVKMTVHLLKGVKQLTVAIVRQLLTLPKDALEIGINLIKGLWEGINDTIGWLMEKIGSLADRITQGIKDAFGIQSPSKVMEDSVGKFLAQGIGVGFEDEMKDVSKQMQNAIPTSFDVNASVNGTAPAVSGYYDMVSAFKEALSDMKIELNDDEVGKFIDKTVTRLVYA